MIKNRLLRRIFLSRGRLIVAAALGLPFVALFILGFLWLLEHGLLLAFIAASAGLGAIAWLVRLLARWRDRGMQGAGGETLGEFSVEPDPEWQPREKAIYAQACDYITELTLQVQDWESLPGHAVEVVNRVAGEFEKKDGAALRFTMPEALLLIERSASRYRAFLRSKVPFSDQVSIATLHWFWKRRRQTVRALKFADRGRRIARFALSPAVGILREIEQLLASGNAGYLTDRMLGTMQAVLLEEVAYAAVELYSGRLRFSDSELLQIELATTAADRARLARPDSPLRILFIGQVSAGKSTLINALLTSEHAETDVAPTTPGLATYELELDDIPCHFIDMPGLDGSADNLEMVLTEMTGADMIVWVVRADRPARAPDRALKDRFDQWFRERPERRKPVVVAVAAGVDRLAKRWPYPEHLLPEDVREKFAAAVAAIAGELEGLKPRPVASVEPPWNLEAVDSALHAGLGEGLMVQRNRLRIEAAGRSGGIFGEAGKGARGMVEGTKHISERIAGRRGGRKDETAGKDEQDDRDQ